MKKIICILLSVLLLFGSSVSVFAQTLSSTLPQSVSRKQAVADSAITMEITAEDGAMAIVDALYRAKELATKACPYIIHVAPGRYVMDRAFHIFSNTSIVADDGAVFINGADDNMVKVGTIGDDPVSGYGYENISVIGGEWNNSGKNTTMFKFVHAKNCVLSGVNAHNIKNAHFVEMAAVDGFKMNSCEFYEMYVDVADGREAIQIDVLQTDHIQGYTHLDDEIEYLCKNISIDGCTFRGVRRAIGSHTVVQGKYFENVSITNNKFVDTVEKSILCYNMKNLTVSGNEISGTDVGIELKTMDKAGAGTYLAQKDKQNGTKANIEALNAEIFNNTVVSKTNHAIIINGVILTSDIAAKAKINDKVLAGNYYVEGVNIHDNTLTAFGKSCAVKVQYAKNVVVNKNTVTAASSAETPIYITDGSSKISVTNNLIQNTVLNGIRVCNLLNGYPKGSINSISGNTIANVKAGGYGIRISDAAVTAVEKNTINKSANIGIQADKNTKTGYSVSVARINSNVIKSSKNAIKVMTSTISEIIGNKISPTTAHSIQIEAKSIAKKIDKNTIATSGQTAIILSQSKAIEINGNVITNPKQMGIYCYNGAACDAISGNKISGAKTNGIVINTAVIKSIDSNTIASCKSFGIYLNGTSKTQVNSVKGNKISSCLLGIKILKGPKANVYVNTLAKNKGGNKYVINGTKQYTLANPTKVPFGAKKSGKTIKLTWTRKSAVSGYILYRSTKASSGYAKLGSAAAKTTSFVDKKAKAKTVYYYRILPYYKVPGSNVVLYTSWTQSKGVKR